MEEGEEVSVEVTLSADPERTVTIPIIKTNADGTVDGDYTGVPESVTFDAGETSMSFDVTAEQDDDTDDESVELSFGALPTGVMEGSTVTTTVTITDDGQRGVRFTSAVLTVEEGSSESYEVVLTSQPTGNVTVAITAPINTDITVSEASLTFTTFDWNAPQRVTVSATADDLDAEDDTGTITHAVSGGDYGSVRADPVSVTVDDDEVSVSFERAAYSVMEGGDAVTVTVQLNAPAEQTFTIDLVKTHRDGATEDDYSGLPDQLTFATGETEQSFGFSALPDAQSDAGESVLLEFANLPVGVIAGSPAQAALTITNRTTVIRQPVTGGGGGGGGGDAPLNRTPEFMEGDRTTRSVAENTPAGANIGEPVAASDFNRDTLTYSLRGVGSDLFDLDASAGQLLTKVALDYETEASYILFVWVQDNKDANGRADTQRDTVIKVAVTVTNEDDPGTVALSSSEPDVDVALTAALTDPDGGVARVVWSWARSADQTAWTAIPGASSAAYTPVAADKGSYLRATASYTDGHGPRKSAQAATAAPVPSNAAPEFTGVRDGVLERSVVENTNAGEAVGAPVAATDAEDEAVTYALGGADAAFFAIDPDTGQIRVGAGTTLDYEADKNVYEVTVTATDSLGLSATVTVTITVTNVGLGSPLGDAYDADGNEAIDRDEVLAALADYFSGVVTREEALEVGRLYFAG